MAYLQHSFLILTMSVPFHIGTSIEFAAVDKFQLFFLYKSILVYMVVVLYLFAAVFNKRLSVNKTLYSDVF